MLPSYESPRRFQEGWSSLQTHSRTPRNPPRGLTLQMGMLGNLKARTALRMCSKNLQLAPNCGTWARRVGSPSGGAVDVFRALLFQASNRLDVVLVSEQRSPRNLGLQSCLAVCRSFGHFFSSTRCYEKGGGPGAQA